VAAGLLLACAAGPQALRDEGSERIEEAMRPELRPDVIPEGILLGSDAPPLAPPEPELASRTARASADEEPPEPGWLFGAVPVIIPGPAYGPHPGSVRYHIEARPGGSIPGLLP
jgi:hypothetical protein